MFKYTSLCINHLRTQSATFLSNQIDLFAQQSRNTFILKRKYPVPLHKKNRRAPRLGHRYFIYDLVENTNSNKPKLIDLVLLKSVHGVGIKGQKVSVNSEKAYINLILPKLAVYATPENIDKYYIDGTNFKEHLDSYSSEYVPRTLRVLSQFYLPVEMSMDIPWNIEKWHVRVAFRKAGVIVPEKAIILPEKTISGPELSIQNKEFCVIVKINNHEEVKVRCKIRHWDFNRKNRITEEESLWDLPNIAIFPEDQPLLDSLPKHHLSKHKSNNVDE
ncbi:39S ribosomal protein L9, mitochondrial [Colletes gigas]|uniref:39S ribosomal protein L9, mitochondrial n=1 Tax=Colletes gigas TaxID=935657 RepID=UPI001C9BAB5B|nr:39S ribosomal protein L9, mitochondrial [Colletes gigas]